MVRGRSCHVLQRLTRRVRPSVPRRHCRVAPAPLGAHRLPASATPVRPGRNGCCSSRRALPPRQRRETRRVICTPLSLIQTGFSLALACDFRISAQGARMGSATLRFGLLPDEGG